MTVRLLVIIYGMSRGYTLLEFELRQHSAVIMNYYVRGAAIINYEKLRRRVAQLSRPQ